MKITLTAIIGLILLTCGGTFYMVKCKGDCSKKAERQDEKQIQQIKNVHDEDTTVHLVGEDNFSHSTSKAATGTKKQLDIFYKDKIKKSAKSSNVPVSNVGVLFDFKEVAVIKGKSNAIDIVKESGNGQKEILQFPINDDCMTGQLIVDEEKREEQHSINITIPVHGTMAHQRSKSFLGIFRYGEKEWRNNFWTDCPSVQIDSLSSIIVTRGFNK